MKKPATVELVGTGMVGGRAGDFHLDYPACPQHCRLYDSLLM